MAADMTQLRFDAISTLFRSVPLSPVMLRAIATGTGIPQVTQTNGTLGNLIDLRNEVASSGKSPALSKLDVAIDRHVAGVFRFFLRLQGNYHRARIANRAAGRDAALKAAVDMTDMHHFGRAPPRRAAAKKGRRARA